MKTCEKMRENARKCEVFRDIINNGMVLFHLGAVVLVTLSWFFSVFNIIGTLLNIFKSPYSFLIWTICNMFWIYYDACMFAHSRLLIDIINLMMSTYGFVLWHRKSKRDGYARRFRDETRKNE